MRTAALALCLFLFAACDSVIILRGFGTAKANIYRPAGLSRGTYRVRFPGLGRPASEQGPVVEAAQIGGVFTLTP